MKLRIAGAQIPVTGEVGANLEIISRAMDYAVDEKADILLTPEGSLSGYSHIFNREEVEKALKIVTQKAKAVGLGLALGTCYIESDNQCYNQLRFYDSDGSFLGYHSKILTCGTLDNISRGEIEHYTVKPLRTFKFKGITIGGLICNDLWANPECTPGSNPHLTQQLARMGARVIFHAVNGGRGGQDTFATESVYKNYHESNLRLRARAGGLWIATVDNSYPLELPVTSPAGIVNPEGNWVVMAPAQGKQLFCHTIGVN